MPVDDDPVHPVERKLAQDAAAMKLAADASDRGTATPDEAPESLAAFGANHDHDDENPAPPGVVIKFEDDGDAQSDASPQPPRADHFDAEQDDARLVLMKAPDPSASL